MKNMKIGDNFIIHCYKHDGLIHRSWDEAILLDIHKDYLVYANSKAKVNNSDGKVWYTKEPAIIYYYKNRWFNVIAQLKKNGIYYYCNISSPSILEGKVIKYIDYDLDLRIFPDGTYKILDESEYAYHKEKMNYSDDIDKIVNYELKNLIKLYESKKGPFDIQEIKKYYEKYKEILENSR